MLFLVCSLPAWNMGGGRDRGELTFWPSKTTKLRVSKNSSSAEAQYSLSKDNNIKMCRYQCTITDKI